MPYRISTTDFTAEINSRINEEMVEFWNRVGETALNVLRHESFGRDRLRNRRNGKRARVYPVLTGNLRRGFRLNQRELSFTITNNVDYIRYIESMNNKRRDKGEYLKQFEEVHMPRILESELRNG